MALSLHETMNAIASTLMAAARRVLGSRAVRAGSALALVLLPSASAGAQTSCGPVAVNTACGLTFALLRVPTLNQVTTSTTTLSLAPTGGAVTVADITLGYAAAVTALTVTVQTNAASNTLASPTSASSVRLTWRVSAAAWSGSGCPYALSALRFSTTLNGTYTAVPTAETALLTGLTGSTALSGRQITLYFRTLLSWNDTPAPSCTLPLQFTVGP